ncbi:MAG: glycosyltransferase family 4 protein [Deltaproteobacteria bacterium]|nr:glycosyltransferase family 4 protein [Deltaproteobacteria bacterium]
MYRILISAYACEPGRGSEGEIGWSLVHELAKRHHVWVLTRANNRGTHEVAFAKEKKPASLNFIYYDTPEWVRCYKKGKRFFLIYYYLWQFGSFFAIRRFLKRQQIDLVHHLTGGMDWMPSGLALLGLPFLWGPVGGEVVHPEILRTLPFSLQLKELFRKFVHFCGRELDPFVRLTGRRARIILSHTPENLPKRYCGKVRPYVQTGILPSERFAKMKDSMGRADSFTVIFAGELVHWKGAAYALEAFLRFAQKRKDVRLVMVGDGPLRPQLQQQVEHSGLSEQVEFSGKVAMDDLLDVLVKGDVFLYPSYHHGLATVVLQAMLTGLPVVCLEGDAVSRAVDETCGFVVPLTKGGDFILGIELALERLYLEEGVRVKFALEAREASVAKYSYTTIASGYDEIYRQLLESQGDLIAKAN